VRRTLESILARAVQLVSTPQTLDRLDARVASLVPILQQQERQALRHAVTAGQTTTLGVRLVHAQHVHQGSRRRQARAHAWQALTTVAPLMTAAPRRTTVHLAAIQGSTRLRQDHVHHVQRVSTRQRRATQVHHARAAVEAIMQPRRDHRVARHAQLGRGETFITNHLLSVLFLVFCETCQLPITGLLSKI